MDQEDITKRPKKGGVLLELEKIMEVLNKRYLDSHVRAVLVNRFLNLAAAINQGVKDEWKNRYRCILRGLQQFHVDVHEPHCWEILGSGQKEKI